MLQATAIRLLPQAVFQLNPVVRVATLIAWASLVPVERPVERMLHHHAPAWLVIGSPA